MPNSSLIEREPERMQEMIILFQRGLPIEDVCDLVGVTERTYYIWQGLARKEREPYFSFFQEVREARKIGRLKALETIHKAIDNYDNDVQTSVKTAQWYLERQDPENWGRRSKKTIEVNVNEGLMSKFVLRCQQLGLNQDEVLQRMLDKLESQLEPGQLTDGKP